MKRKRIEEGETVEVRMTTAERDLVFEHTMTDPDYRERLQAVPGKSYLAGPFTLEDLEDLLGSIAAEANHSEDAKVRKRLDTLHAKLCEVQRSYDDGNWQDSDS